MGPLIWRELVVVSRTAAFWIAAAAYVTVLTLFVTIWGDGLPIAGGGTDWEQFIAVQRTALMFVLPWTAVRCATTPPHALALLAMATARAPSSLLIAKSIALTAALSALALLAVPVMLPMQQIAALSLAPVAVDLLPVFGLAAFVAAVTTACTLLPFQPLAGWLIVTASTAAAGLLMPLTPAAVPMWLGVAVLAAAPTVVAADRKLMYLPEEWT